MEEAVAVSHEIAVRAAARDVFRCARAIGAIIHYCADTSIFEVCNVSTDLDLKHHRIVQLKVIWGFFTCLSLPFLFSIFSGNSCEDKDITLEHKANDHSEHWIGAMLYYFNQLLIVDKVV